MHDHSHMLAADGGLTVTNWVRFFVWLLIGLVLYHFYGRKHSGLSTAKLQAA